MSKETKSFFLRLAAIGAAACSSVYAARPGGDLVLTQAMPAGKPIASTPYKVELVGEDGRTLETFQKGDRYYVLGAASQRYSIRVVNPTARRVEAVISVDGLDVIDGGDADFTGKRGYIVPPNDDLVIDGFRTSQTDVAAFRFSSVADSYADRKGKGRNVGVIGVAIFEEQDAPEIIVGDNQPPPPPVPSDDPVDRWIDHDHQYGATGGGATYRGHGGGKDVDRPNEQTEGQAMGKGAGAVAPSAVPDKEKAYPSDKPDRTASSDDEIGVRSPVPDGCCGHERSTRPGLGTQWGEQRYSAVNFTRFQRRNPALPDAIAELRYNDRDGLAALGLVATPVVDANEVNRRETADPFPSSHFATPP